MLTRTVSMTVIVFVISTFGCSRQQKDSSADNDQGGQSFAEVKAAAEKGNAKSQLKLGQMYRYGNGTPRNAEEAVKWLRKSGEQGNIEAMSQLYRAGLYPNAPDYTFTPDGRQMMSGTNLDSQNPLPVPQDEAFSWLKKAADRGDKTSMFFMGAAHHNGHGGIKMDLNQAKSWYEKAANQGHQEAEVSLAIMLLRTDSPISDPAQGMTWLKKAAIKGHPDAQQTLKEIGAGGK